MKRISKNSAAYQFFKKLAGYEAAKTDTIVLSLGFGVEQASRGEPAFVVKGPMGMLGQALEVLGTKSLVAQEMERLTGSCHWWSGIGWDAVAVAAMDTIAAGIYPLGFNMLVIADRGWFGNSEREAQLLAGVRHACEAGGFAQGEGETARITRIIASGVVLLGGACFGVIPSKDQHLHTKRICGGDAIVLVRSSGIHTNGLTEARALAEPHPSLLRRIGHRLFPERVPIAPLPKGYLTRVDGEATYGELLLERSYLYVDLVKMCFSRGVKMHAVLPITGGGMKKLYRGSGAWIYQIEELCVPHPIFRFIQEHGGFTDEEIYGIFNTGNGVAIILPSNHVSGFLSAAKECGYEAIHAGRVIPHPEKDKKKILLVPKSVSYEEDVFGISLADVN